MTHAAITGWGKCLPPAVLTNQDLSEILDTSDEWIRSRTGIEERRVAHVSLTDMCHVAAERALAAADVDAGDIELIVVGSCSFDDQVPNTASGIQERIGAGPCAAMDINTACTSFLYGLSSATAMIRTGVVSNALVIGGEVISPYMDWTNRNVAVLFGDGAAAVVVEATENAEGVIGERLGCYGGAREILRVHGMGTRYANQGRHFGDVGWAFEGQDIFKRAVIGMAGASEGVLRDKGCTTDEIDLVVPHQANLRIIEALAKRAGVPMERVFVNVHRYGNMSAATVPVALCEALEEGRVNPGDLLLTPAFGGGLTWCAHLIRWGERTTPLRQADIDLPPVTETAIDIVTRHRDSKRSIWEACP